MQELIDDVPLYVNAKEVCREDGSVEALELNYLTFYAHNGSCAPDQLPCISAHLRVVIPYYARLAGRAAMLVNCPSELLRVGASVLPACLSRP